MLEPKIPVEIIGDVIIDDEIIGEAQIADVEIIDGAQMAAVEIIGEAIIDDVEIIGDPMIPQALPNKMDIFLSLSLSF